MPGIIKESLTGWELINDLGALPENENIITDFLLERLQRGQIYTWIGSLLLTLNPSNEMSPPDLYNSLFLDKNVNVPEIIYGGSPHIFTVAAKAHYNLTNEIGKNCQVIVISGETGTGKTFNACKCLEFFSTINKCQLSEGDTCDIMLRITDACRVISAFTTACTEKNEVSSRHGQLVRLHYKSGTISGATITSFLLERSRVTRGSNNFQIFYQIIFGMSDAELEALNLSKEEYYDILNVIDYNKRKYFQKGFQDTLRALDVLGFKPDQKKQIFQVFALLIHMGNIKFIEKGENCTVDLNNNKSKEALKSTSTLSCLTEDAVIELLTTILINPQSVWRKHTTYHRHLLTVDACRNRLHSIIRHIYDLLFNWILNHINRTLSLKQEYSQWLGILDIFGFESFDTNGIEQLYVNYANEKMQQNFVETYVESRRNDLLEEGFIESISPLHTIDLYKERLHVIEENLFLTLNDASQSPVAMNTLTIIRLACNNFTGVQRKFLSEKDGNFVISHYAGPVAYSIRDLLYKNTDKVPNEISLIFNASRNKFLRSLFIIEEEQQNVKTCTKKKTMLAKLKYNMDSLIKELSKCDLHYVRCVKPNRLINYEWDRKDFKKQLACIGVFDVLPLVKCKYPIRLRYRDFYHRYSKKPTETTDPEKCKLILESIASKKDLFALVYFGKQLIFLAEPIFIKLESYRRNYRAKCADRIKAFFMRHRRKAEPLFVSKYSMTNDQKSDINETVTSIKNILEHELNRVENKSSSSEGDEVFTNSPLHLRNINGTEKDVDDVNSPENKNSGISKKIQHDRENRQKKLMDLRQHLKHKRNESCFQGSVAKFMKKMNTEYNFKSKQRKSVSKYIVGTKNSCNDNNNNLLKQYLDIHVPSVDVTDSADKNTSPVQYDTMTDLYTVQTESCLLFYKKGVLNRRRLATLPIKVHTQATCLFNSHVIPRKELPQGLQDCL
ncbi:unconventional myosin-XIX-like [Ceratina calcarata]|uniref:Unconventional myosin-XIX-like n=1 Tax=Ceratina calcarata TaxID=156304 RepID=A0AAJ7N3U0_9HYME|nr:unconventional myosin-XIX-like [Ceratina calcarata]